MNPSYSPTIERPGRTCPLHYRYSPAIFNRHAEVCAETLYVVGGLYGNPFALESIIRTARQEAAEPVLVFNGDFNWFNVDGLGFRQINETVLKYRALRGNVESELADDQSGAGCGCGYPDWVSDIEVARSNQIIEVLKTTAQRFPDILEHLRSLPMHLVACVGGVRIGIVHGDADSLAGWEFSREALTDPCAEGKYRSQFEQAKVRIFTSTHTCLPAMKRVPLQVGFGLIVNNGSAGMSNLQGTQFGLVTRISTTAARTPSLCTERLEELYIDLLRIEFDGASWVENFLMNWPAGSPGHDSYFGRITQGPSFAGPIKMD